GCGDRSRPGARRRLVFAQEPDLPHRAPAHGACPARDTHVRDKPSLPLDRSAVFLVADAFHGGHPGARVRGLARRGARIRPGPRRRAAGRRASRLAYERPRGEQRAPNGIAMTSAKIRVLTAVIAVAALGASFAGNSVAQIPEAPGTFTDSNGVKILQIPSGMSRGRVDQAEKEKTPVSDMPAPDPTPRNPGATR